MFFLRCFAVKMFWLGEGVFRTRLLMRVKAYLLKFSDLPLEQTNLE